VIDAELLHLLDAVEGVGRDRLLIGGEEVQTEMIAFLQRSQRAGFVVEADQQKRPIQRQ